MEEKSLISLDPFIILEFLVWNVMCIQELKLFPQDFLFTNSNDEDKKVLKVIVSELLKVLLSPYLGKEEKAELL